MSNSIEDLMAKLIADIAKSLPEKDIPTFDRIYKSDRTAITANGNRILVSVFHEDVDDQQQFLFEVKDGELVKTIDDDPTYSGLSATGLLPKGV